MAFKRSGTSAKSAKPAPARRSPLKWRSSSVPTWAPRTPSPRPSVSSIPEYEEIREQHEKALRQMWLSFDEALNERATAMHFQRIVGSLVSSAVGAGRFYSERSRPRELTSRLASDDRDDDREAPVGLESKAQRSANSPPNGDAGLRSARRRRRRHQRLSGNHRGGMEAYQAPTQGPATVERRSAAAEVNAFTA